ncbi:MAG: hypothetical protein VYE77_00675 [Planctomycetota bacterium]|nr:hypothetical protein [Planctomycetota bacterium]
MRAWILLAGVALPACGSPRAEPLAGDGELVVELGGAHGSLAASLRSLGFELLPVERLGASQPVTAGAVRAQGVAGDLSPAAAPPGEVVLVEAPEPEPVQPPAPPVRVEPQEVVVRLQSGQTLMALAEAHLGSRQRYKEILRCNGWSEEFARRLPIGQRVRIPVAVAGGR